MGMGSGDGRVGGVREKWVGAFQKQQQQHEQMREGWFGVTRQAPTSAHPECTLKMKNPEATLLSN